MVDIPPTIIVVIYTAIYFAAICCAIYNTIYSTSKTSTHIVFGGERDLSIDIDKFTDTIGNRTGSFLGITLTGHGYTCWDKSRIIVLADLTVNLEAIKRSLKILYDLTNKANQVEFHVIGYAKEASIIWPHPSESFEYLIDDLPSVLGPPDRHADRRDNGRSEIDLHDASDIEGPSNLDGAVGFARTYESDNKYTWILALTSGQTIVGASTITPRKLSKIIPVSYDNDIAILNQITHGDTCYVAGEDLLTLFSTILGDIFYTRFTDVIVYPENKYLQYVVGGPYVSRVKNGERYSLLLHPNPATITIEYTHMLSSIPETITIMDTADENFIARWKKLAVKK